MIARLILVLLLAAFAVPTAAPAACHDASTSTAHAGMTMAGDSGDVTHASDTMRDTLTDQKPDQKAVPLHGCIGCIPPSNWQGAGVSSVAPADTPALAERAAVLDIGMVAAPVPPPPRDA